MITSNNRTRRKFVKSSGAIAAGALGSLAGCIGGNSDNGDSGGGGSGGKNAGSGSSEGGSSGGGSQTATISHMTGLGAETSATKGFFKESMKRFEETKGNVKVDLQFVTTSDIRQKLPSTMNAGNAPNIAESGTLGITFWKDGKTVDHGKYIEGSDLVDNWNSANVVSSKYRGEWWSGGSTIEIIRLLGVRPKLFKEAGFDDPSQFEKTWTDYRRALNSVQETFSDVFPYEESGEPNDLETYWAQAQTAWTDGKDPWFQGEQPWEDIEGSLLIGREGRTDGMIKNCVDLAKTYSSPTAPTRTNEEIPAMMLTDKVASFMTATGNSDPWTSVKKDVTFGWDGDLYATPIPKLDPNYGAEFNLPDLEGKEGAYGGTSQLANFQNQIYTVGNEDVAWDLNHYLHTNPDHGVPLFGEVYQSIPTYTPHLEQIKKEYEGELPGHFESVLDAVANYSANYHPTGGAWDLENTDAIRWDAINQTISQAIAGQHSRDEIVSLIRDRVIKAASG